MMSVDWWRCPLHFSRKSILLSPLLVLSCIFFFLHYNIRLTIDPYPKHGRALADEATCTPHNNVIFLKTHKCASSTIQNVLIRYGDTRNLTFAMHPKINYLGHPQPFRRTMVPNLTQFNLSYNMLVHHSILDRDEMVAVIPDDPVFLTIVRDPVLMFESLYSYYGLGSFYRLPLTKFSNFPSNSHILRFRSMQRFGPNQMLFDLGMNRDQLFNLTAVKEYVRYLDEEVFDLVLVAEKMDESLILLRHLLCWDIEDIIVFRVNARSDKYKRHLPAKVRERLRSINGADQILYDHFRSIFENRLDAFGRVRMAREVGELRTRVKAWYDFCVRGRDMLKRIPGAYQKVSSPQVMAYMPKNNTNETCLRLTIPELDFTDRVRQKQMYMFPEVKKKQRILMTPSPAISTKKKRKATIRKKQRS